MLILFKPWQTAFDLRTPQDSWQTAFDNFKTSSLCSDEFKQMMNNMQLLHECKDSHDDHFHERHSCQLRLAPEIAVNETAPIEDTLEGINDSQILQHLESIDDCYSEQKTCTNFNTLDCIEHAEQGGLFYVTPSDAHYRISLADCVHVEQLHLNSVDLEGMWKTEYDCHHDTWKQKTTTHTDHSISPTSTTDSARMSTDIIDGNGFQATTSLRALELLIPSIELQSNTRMLANTVDTEQLACKWLLNPEQQQAFKIITKHSIHRHENPLRMFISGAAGTGKTRVINTVKDFFEQRGQPRRF
jgi:hypothetical protein